MTLLAGGLSHRLRCSRHYISSLLPRLVIKRAAVADMKVADLYFPRSKATHHTDKTCLTPSSPTGNCPPNRTINTDHMFPLPDFSIKDLASRLQNFGISEGDIEKNPELLTLPSGVIEHRVKFLSEGGITVNIEGIVNFDSVSRSSVHVLKSKGTLPKDITVPEKILSNFSFKGSPPPIMDENLSYQQVHFQTVCHYMQESFGFSFPNWKRYFNACLTSTIQNILLFRTIGLHWQWIRNHPSLTCYANPSNLSKLKEVDNFVLPITIRKLLRLEPRTALVDPDYVVATFFVLMKHKICKHDILEGECNYFMMAPELLDFKLKQLQDTDSSKSKNKNFLASFHKITLEPPVKNIPDYPGQLLTPKYTPDVNYENFASERVSLKKEIQEWLITNKCLVCKNCRHRSSSISTSHTKLLDRIPHYLSDRFDLKPDHVREELSHLSQWFHVKLGNFEETLNYLLESGYEERDVLETLQLCLYPRHLVQEIMEQCVMSDPVHGSDKYKKRHLQLCLYFILRKFDYSLSKTLQKSKKAGK